MPELDPAALDLVLPILRCPVCGETVTSSGARLALEVDAAGIR